MAKRIVWTGQAKADIRAIEQPIAIQILKTPARTGPPGLFRDHGDYLKIERVLDRKDAYR